MDRFFSANQLTGNWTVQSMNSSSVLNRSQHKNQFIDRVEWTYVKDSRLSLNLLLKNVRAYYPLLNSAELYLVKSKDSNNASSKHYILLAYHLSELKLLIKLSDNFTVLDRFFAQGKSSNYLMLRSCDQGVDVIEKIYFLNRNLKVIKSTIRKKNRLLGISFSSEIRTS